MPPTDEPPQSTSAWQWDPHYRLYYNQSTRQWAAPQPDGSWKYADADPPAATDDDGLEEGEIEGRVFDIPHEQIWPGDDDERVELDPFAHAPLLRLVVKKSEPAVLPPGQSIAALDPAEPVSIGRDRSHQRRIRLRELAVSKAHATLFWSVDPDAHDGGFWAVVDNGSTHGTFLASSDQKGNEIRLSEPKKGGVPHRLHHLDTLRAGSTTFVVHIHPSFACSACTVASDSSNLIPLLSTPTDDSSKSAPTYATKTKEEKEQERREQMRGLKEKLLKPTAKGSAPPPPMTASSPTAPPRTSSPAFVDRAAARRARDAGATKALPAAAKPSPRSPFFTVPGRTPTSSFAAAPATTTISSSSAANSSAANPFASDSKGAQLLSKLSGPPSSVSPTTTTTTSAAAASSTPQGPPSGSGSGRAPGLGTLIAARTFDTNAVGRDARPGLGSRPLVDIATISGSGGAGGGGAGSGSGSGGEKRDWREDVREASRKRFREMG
ncbi:hypothetical protein JCM1840_005546 [Sporobolomyces johnsonii]